ncbi:hypothetical protein ACJMK2_033329 [Sinanodonta woodiana]|uniref:DBB domain-containing protein n=1 Tax=Sinanodonta woodiana TaxID=1069815 RepID=A0ABD3WN19_SINWO
MSTEVYHNIFYQFDGGTLAHEIKDFFARKRYNIQFNLHKLQDADTRKASNSGVSILLITPESYGFIQSRKDSDLNKLFPNPDFSLALLFHVGKSVDEIKKILAARVTNSQKWSFFEFAYGSGLSTLGIHIMQIVEKVESNSLPSTSVRQFQVWQSDNIKPHQHVVLIFDKPVDEGTDVKVLQEWDCVKQEAKHLNCMTYSFIIGDVKPGERNIEVLLNNVSYGKAMIHVQGVEPKKERITTLLQSVINPVDFLCQCLHIVPENREDLDLELAELLSADKNSVSNNFDQHFGDLHSKSVLPTLLHFGAKYGLTQFCLELTKLPGSQNSLRLKNKDGLLPCDIAMNGGFDDLAVLLKTTEEDSDDVFPPSTKPKGEKQKSFRDQVSYQNYPLHPGCHENIVGAGSRAIDILQRSESSISPDYTASNRRMTDVTGNLGCSRNLRRNQSLPLVGKIKRKEHHYDLPSDTP